MLKGCRIASLFLSLLLPVAVLSVTQGLAADFPKKPIKLVVASAVGGAEDAEARALAPLLQKHLGVQVSVEDQPGAGGKICFEKLQRTEPDGSTIAIYTFPKSVIIEYMDKVSYRTKDFTPVYGWSKGAPLMVVSPDSWKTFGEFLATAKSKAVSGAISSRGGVIHLVGLIVMHELGARVNWVPYDSSAQSLTAMAGKHVDFAICLTASAGPLLDAGRIKPLILLGDERDPYLPNVPIPKELGINIPVVPAIHVAMAPPKTPAPIVKVLEAAFGKAAREPMFVDFMKKRKTTLDYVDAQELGKAVVDVYPKLEKIAPMLKD